MILVDKSKLIQAIILTPDGFEIIPTLWLKNDASRREYSIALGEDESTAPERYSQFNVDTDLFDELPEGYYSYQIRSLGDGDEVESGKLYVRPGASDELPEAPTNNTTLIYTK